MSKKLEDLKKLLIKYQRFGEGLTTKVLREQIQKLEKKHENI